MFRRSLGPRSQLLVDPRIQGPVLTRVLLYASACAIYFMVVLFFNESARIRNESIPRALGMCLDVLVCWAPGLVLFIPVIAYDALDFTRRLASPMERLRREMQRLIDGESDQPMPVRGDDYWPEMAELFNQIRLEMQQLRSDDPGITKTLFAAAQTAEAKLAAGLQRSTGDGPRESLEIDAEPAAAGAADEVPSPGLNSAP